jgi:hypothetical protein
MAKVEQHDLSEYYINLDLNLGNAAEEWHIPVPQAGYIDRMYYTQTTEQSSANAVLTFWINSVATVPAGHTVTTAGAAEGHTDVIRFSANNAANYVMEPEDGDLEGKGGVFSIATDGGGTGTGTFCIVIRR